MSETLGPSYENLNWMHIHPMQVHAELADAVANERTKTFLKQAGLIILGQAAGWATTGASAAIGNEAGNLDHSLDTGSPGVDAVMDFGYFINGVTDVGSAVVDKNLVESEFGVAGNPAVTGINRLMKWATPSLHRMRRAVEVGIPLVITAITQYELYKHEQHYFPNWRAMLTTQQYGGAFGGTVWNSFRYGINYYWGKKEQPDTHPENADKIEQSPVESTTRIPVEATIFQADTNPY